MKTFVLSIELDGFLDLCGAMEVAAAFSDACGTAIDWKASPVDSSLSTQDGPLKIRIYSKEVPNGTP